MMNLYATPEALREALILSGTVRLDGGVVVTNPARFRAEMIDALVWTAVFAPKDARDAARHAIREAAESLGILPASILPLYRARGRGEISGFTVPAINIRMMSYDSARAALRAAKKLDVGAMIFEIARSEMGYTEQRPAEYAAVMLAAAIREEWQGPFFIQGDHFQTNPKKMKESLRKPSAEVLQQIAKAMRISAESLYVRAGIVNPVDGVGGSVELAVLGDTRLTERQKQSLLDVYASFLALNGAVEKATSTDQTDTSPAATTTVKEF